MNGSAPCEKIAVAVGKHRSGFYALKWALENVPLPGGTIYLMHVKYPIRCVPTPDGYSLPLEELSVDVVENFKKQRAIETESLISWYRKICDEAKVKVEVCFSENDLVEEELVNQISVLGIAKLFIGTSTYSKISKAFKGERISSYVVKNAPDFCAVSVVYKGKLLTVKDATGSIQSSIRTSSSAASDISISSSEATEDSTINFNSPPRLSRESAHASSSSISFDKPRRCISSVSFPSFDDQAPEASPITYFEETATDSNGHVQENWKEQTNSSLKPFGELVTSTPESVSTENVKMLPTSHKIADTLEISSSVDNDNGDDDDDDALFEIKTMKTIPSFNATQMPRGALQLKLQESGSALVTDEDIDSDSIEVLKSQRDLARREADLQANRCKQALKMAEEYEAQRNEEIRRRDKALREARTAKQQALREARRSEELLAALTEASKKVEDILMENEIHKQNAADEARKYAERQSALDASTRLVEAAMRDAALAKEQAEAETNKCKEALLEVQETRRATEELEKRFEELKVAFEIETRLRKEAEERLLHESITKHEALAALQRFQQKYTVYTFEELQAATSEFHDGNKLGEGSYGPVFKGKLHETTVAIKVLAQEFLKGKEDFQCEVEFLSQIHHPHIVILLGACPERACIVYEYMENGSLEDHLFSKNDSPLPWYIRCRICFEVATALVFLHSQPKPIVHRDLKPGNILLNHNFVSKIGDVGLAHLVQDNMRSSGTSKHREPVVVDTYAYMDPDYQRTGIFSRESDVYALGIVILQLLTGRPAVGVAYLVENALDDGQLQDILDKSAGNWPLAEAMELASLSLQCAEPKRKHRPHLGDTVLGKLERIRNVADAAAACAGTPHPNGDSGSSIYFR